MTLQVENLRTVLDTAAGAVRAVDGIDFELRKGECFALVGESGSGKSMTALSVMRLLPEAGRITAGRVGLDGIDLLALPEAAMRAVRGRRVAMVFQEPSTARTAPAAVSRTVRRFSTCKVIRPVLLPEPADQNHLERRRRTGSPRARG